MQNDRNKCTRKLANRIKKDIVSFYKKYDTSFDGVTLVNISLSALITINRDILYALPLESRELTIRKFIDKMNLALTLTNEQMHLLSPDGKNVNFEYED